MPLADLQQLAAHIKADGRGLLLEVVTQTRSDELLSVQAAIDLNVDDLLGGQQAKNVAAMLAGNIVICDCLRQHQQPRAHQRSSRSGRLEVYGGQRVFEGQFEGLGSPARVADQVLNILRNIS